MPTYSHENIIARFLDELAGISVSGLLSNQGTFHIKVSPGAYGEFFTFQSPDYQTHLVVDDGVVEFRRNSHVARRKIGSVERHFQILLSWQPERFQLALMIDDDVGGNNACVTVETNPIFIPVALLTWARRFNLLPRTTYSSPAEFLSVLIESIRQTEQNIRRTNSYNLFWDRQRLRDSKIPPVPKRESEAMSGVAALLQDQSIVLGFELIQESNAGAGRIDLRALAPLTSGGFAKVCLEGKNAHSKDLEHGIINQLPSYMECTGANYGVYLVLWYRCDAFPYPRATPNAEGMDTQNNKQESTEIDLHWRLTKLRPSENIVVELFHLAIPLSPSDPAFRYVQ